MNEPKRLLPPLAGGLIFILISVIFQTLFSEDPSYAGAIVGGITFAIVWFAMSRLFRKQRED